MRPAAYAASTWCARVAAAWQLGVFAWLLWPHPEIAAWYAIVLAPAIVLIAAVGSLYAVADDASARSRRAIFFSYGATAMLAPSFTSSHTTDPTTMAITCAGFGVLWLLLDGPLTRHWIVFALMLVPGLITVWVQGNRPAMIGAGLVLVAQLWHAADAVSRIGPDEPS